MRCPKCGHDNPQDTLFCEECDWRLDVRYREPKKRNPLAFSAVAVVVGVIALALSFIDGTALAGAVIGAVGLVVGSYSVNLPRYIPDCNRGLCTGLAAVGMVLSVIGFILGLIAYAGA